jgi:hypothetical protein
MKKLSLKLEELSVESFATGPQPGQRGTVQAHATARCNTNVSCQGTCALVCGTYYCVPTEGAATCDIYCTPYTGGTSCNQPCVYTCDNAPSCNPQNTCIQTCANC